MRGWSRWRLKWILRLYAPLLGAGVKVNTISEDWKQLEVSMPLRWYNKNIVGTHFGGSLYAMTDPFFMLMLMKILGKSYIVWDQSASIDFIQPGRGEVRAAFNIDDDTIDDIIARTADGEKYLPEFVVEVVDTQGQIVAKVHKILYVRRKRD